MQRRVMAERSEWQQKLETIGLSFHSWDNYWRESACYQFDAQEIDVLEAATQNLHQLCLQAVDHIVRERRFDELAIPGAFHMPIVASWQAREPSLYGRFDFAYDGQSAPKMLEYNADTPTSLLESAVAQWYWLEDWRRQDPSHQHWDQFNSLHERLVSRWQELAIQGELILTSISENEEDWVCTHYLMECATQAGLRARHLYLEDLGWDEQQQRFVDLEGQVISNVFKLYPWEWLQREPFGIHIANSKSRWIEPLWKCVLSCKGILPILWELFPNHPNLLEAHFAPPNNTSTPRSWVRKPLYSREGASIASLENGQLSEPSPGEYGEEGWVFQEKVELKSWDGWFPVIGSWVVGDEPAGMCLREDRGPITTNMSHFVPHFFEN